MNTPRTDAAVVMVYSDGNAGMGDDYAEEMVSAELSRTLEDEVNKLTDILHRIVNHWKEAPPPSGMLDVCRDAKKLLA